MLPILQSREKISLRIIDWFVTNYSKKNNICFLKKLGENEILFNVYGSYKLQLKAYTKKQFDPFCRRNRIKFYYGEGIYLVTTVGQLNFFKWALENDIINYINTHLDVIETDMNTNIKHIYKSKTKTSTCDHTKTLKKVRKKRRELSTSATKSLNKHFFKGELSFN